jgi:biopolymer transport protein ExbB
MKRRLLAIAAAFLVFGAASTLADDKTTSAPIAVASLPRDLSPWGMFQSADTFVKAVMIGLAFASLVTWTVALVKGIEVIIGSRKLASEIGILRQARTMAEAVAGLTRRGRLQNAVLEAQNEATLSVDLDLAGVKERIASQLEREEAYAGRLIGRATGILATIGATAPFVGLFGAVWGVMNSFIGISKQHTTNLAIVAPGIAEALLATALGLVAAIPAVVFYNLLARGIASYRARYADGLAAILRLASRELDRAGATPQTRVRPSAAE